LALDEVLNRVLICSGYKGAAIAPALQAAHADLQKAQLEDKLEGRLERRPDREDLERRGIVSRSRMLPSLLIAEHPSILSSRTKASLQHCKER
jgi:hypothetical protein